MSFIETPRFPEKISMHATGGPQWSTDVVITASGVESRNQNWQRALCQFDVGHAARVPADFKKVRDFYRAMRGRFHGFRFKDWSDYSATVSEGVMYGTAGTPSYQMTKAYTAGSLTEYRYIYKPINPCLFYRNGTTVTIGGAAGNISVNYTTGAITFVADDSRSISSIAVGSSTDLTLSGSLAGATTGKLIYFTGITGTAATLLNALPLTIVSNIVNVVRVAVNTTGLTASGGTAFMYPQVSDVLTWSGDFDVPCRFDTDMMDVEIIDRSIAQGLIVGWQSIAVREIRL